MTKRKSRWKIISISGYVVTGFGILGVVWSFLARPSPEKIDFGLSTAYTAIVLIGLFATAIAESLRGLEERLDQIESLKRRETTPLP